MARGKFGSTITFADTSEQSLVAIEWTGDAGSRGKPYFTVWPTQSGTCQVYYVDSGGTARTLGNDAKFTVTANEAAAFALDVPVTRCELKMTPDAGSGTAIAEGGYI